MKKVTFVGVGALGSHTILLVRNVEAKLRAIDFDRVEQKNLQSQVHTSMGVGKNKAQALSRLMQGLYKIRIEALPRELTPDNVEQLLGGSDLVVDAVDNGDTRRLIQAYARETNTPCLHGALSADGMYGRVVWDEDFTVDDEDVKGQATCEGGEHLPFIGMVSGILAAEVRNFLSDNPGKNYNISPSGIFLF